MEVLEHKLSSNNPVLITHGISKILDEVKKKISNNDKNNDVSKITELNILFMNCKSDNYITSSVACQAIVSLVNNGLLTIPETLSKFVSILGETKNYSSLTSAICDLLVLNLKMLNFNDNYNCPFSIKVPQHPLITVMILKNDSWRNIFIHMQTMIHQSKPEYLQHYVELLRPVFMYLLCNPNGQLSDICKQQTWHLLIKTSDTLNLQLNILQWLKTNDSISCIDTNNRLLELAEFLIINKNIDYCTAISPMIINTAIELLHLNCDFKQNIVMMENIIDYVDKNIGSLIMCLLIEMIPLCPSTNLYDIIKISSMIIDKLYCNKFIGYSLIASILPWMAYANILSSQALDISNDLIKKIINKNNWNESKYDLSSNKIHSVLCHSHQTIQFYNDICICINTWSNENFNKWLDQLFKSTNNYMYKHRLILSGIFLYTNNLEILKKTSKILCKIIKEYPNYASNVLSQILYKLSNTNEINNTYELLIMIPEMVVSKENLPIVIHTLETLLKSDESLKYFAIELYLKAWKIEPRCHRYLLAALIDISKNDTTIKGNITAANAMKFICENRSEHGAELVPLLSFILNKCSDTGNSGASALALRGISALCISGVADVCSTWQVLSPKMNKEERSIVIQSICEFFKDISADTIHLKEDLEKLIRIGLTKLWEYALFDTTRDINVVKSAFNALSAYTISQMELSDLPDNFKSHLKSSSSKTIKNNNDDDNIKKEEEIKKEKNKNKNDHDDEEENLLYIPSTCWITMLQVIYEPTRTLAGDLIIKFISDELYSFKTGIYMWPMGEPVNFKYLPEKSPSKAIGEYIRKYEYPSSPENQKIVLECLRIYSYKYIKPLPPIKFDIFNSAIKISDNAFNYVITISCHQSAVSQSARDFLSNYIKNITKNITLGNEKFDKAWKLCTNLEDICRGVTSNIVGPFLELITNYIVERAIVDIDNSCSMFEILMNNYSNAIKNDLVHHDNETLITNILEKLLNKINYDNKIFKYLVKALVDLPIEIIERITLPSVWNDITNDKLKKAIIVRSGLVLKRDNEIPLSWMNEMIRAAIPLPGVHKCFFECMKTIQSELKHEKSNVLWCWDLMCQIQATIHTSDNKSIESAKFLSDLLFVTIIYEATENCTIELSNNLSIINSHEIRVSLFPQAISILSTMPHWKDAMQQTMEWLHYMRTTSLPISYKNAYHNSLISLKNQHYLNDNWTKYFSTKSPIDLS